MKSIFFGLMLSCAACAQAGISTSTVYKWVDAKGVTHYGDKPAGAGESSRQERVLDKAQLSAPDDVQAQQRLAKAGRDAAQAKRESADGAKAAAEAKDVASAKAKACEGAKESVRALASGGRVATVNAKGEREFLDEGQVASRLEQAKRAQEQACALPK